MAGLVGTGGPPAFIAFPCVVIYIKLMKHITSRPMTNGLNIDKEKVQEYPNPLLQTVPFFCLDIAQEDKLDDSGWHDDVDNHNVGDGGDLHPDLHRALPLNPHDNLRETQHQLPGADHHLHGRNGGDNTETGYTEHLQANNNIENLLDSAREASKIMDQGRTWHYTTQSKLNFHLLSPGFPYLRLYTCWVRE